MQHVRTQHDRAESRAESSTRTSRAVPAGESLSGATRAALEPRFHHDFGTVRIHHDARADADARALDADAFTVGEEIHFREGAYAPDTLQGATLLTHELAHVVQHEAADPPMALVSPEHDASEAEAWNAAQAVMGGGEASVSSHATSAIARSPFGSLNTFLGLPGKVLGGMPELKGLNTALSPITSTLGALGGIDKMMNADDALGVASGALGTGSGILGLTKSIGADSLSSGALGTIGGIGGLLGAAGSGLDAYSNFSEGNYGKGALDALKTTGGALSGLASLGGFSLSSVGGMGAGAALTGGGGSGLAALGPAGAVIGAGMAGVGLGTYLSENTSVGEHSVDSMGGLDAMLTGEGERPWALSTLEAAEENWDEGNYLSSIGDYGKLAGFATVGALGGIGGGLVDAGGAAVDAVGDAGSWAADNLNPLDWF